MRQVDVVVVRTDCKLWSSSCKRRIVDFRSRISSFLCPSSISSCIFASSALAKSRFAIFNSNTLSDPSFFSAYIWDTFNWTSNSDRLLSVSIEIFKSDSLCLQSAFASLTFSATSDSIDSLFVTVCTLKMLSCSSFAIISVFNATLSSSISISNAFTLSNLICLSSILYLCSLSVKAILARWRFSMCSAFLAISLSCWVSFLNKMSSKLCFNLL